MAVSDQLHTLADRAKQAEDNVTAARTKAKAQLEADVKAAQDSAKQRSQALRAKADEGDRRCEQRQGGPREQCHVDAVDE